MKGITPVIAVILLLLVTISIIGFAFVWFSRIGQSVMNATGTQVESGTSAMQQTVILENAKGTSVTVRNSGSVNIETSKVSVYVNGEMKACTWDTDPITPGGVSTCDLTPVTCSTGQTVKATSPGTPEGDTGTCS